MTGGKRPGRVGADRADRPAANVRMEKEGLVSFADSGAATDAVHVVHLRNAPGGTVRGTVRGALREYLLHQHVLYRRSAFTLRDAHGELQYIYFPVTNRRA